MGETFFIFWFLSAFSIVCGIGLLFVKTNKEEADQVSKFLPGASLYQYDLMRYLGSVICFVLAGFAAFMAIQ